MQTRSSEERTARVRAAIYALLANGWRYPDESLVELLHAGNTGPSEDIESVSLVLSAVLRDLHRELADAESASRLLDLDGLRAAHSRLFGHSVRGSCPPYELEYGRSEIIQQTAELSDLTGFYRAFGMDLGDSAFERADHISVECEFLSILCAKEAWGMEQSLPELTETCLDAQRLFLRDHLARWAPAFAHRVTKAEVDSFYGRLASVAAVLIAEECHRFDIEVGPQWLELRPVDRERDAEIDCDSGCSGAPENQLVQVGIQAPLNRDA